MGKDKLRSDKTCLNCRHVVENRYCPNCGQENTNTRKTFHHLFYHFFEDLTHYENAFWKTIKNLLFRPSALTKEYLSGKRLSYLAPVRLYIFISFVTFFLISVLPDADIKTSPIKVTESSGEIKVDSKKVNESKSPDSTALAILKVDEMLKSGLLSKKDADLIKKDLQKRVNERDKFSIFGIKTVEQLDSIQKFGKEDDRLTDWEYKIEKRLFEIRDNNTKDELLEKFKESFTHNFPKVLFIYMPIFAFFLWIFHSKKKWYYFDHGIFTLHYFSFLLLIFLIDQLIESFLYLFGENIVTIPINAFFSFLAYGWMFYYFFPAHHRFYGESRLKSFIKSILLFFINSFWIVVILLFFAIYTFLTIH